MPLNNYTRQTLPEMLTKVIHLLPLKGEMSEAF